MKIHLSTTALAVAALLAGTAVAGDRAGAEKGAEKHGTHGMLRADTNGDGKISREEAAAFQDKVQGDWFDRNDLDKDGFVTTEELRQARSALRDQKRGQMRERAQARFKEADANGDGQLSLDEVQASMPKLAERFTALDADKNGLLSKDEFKRAGPGGGHRGHKRDSGAAGR